VAYTDAITTTAADAAYVPKTLVDAKGDILTATADNTPARLAVGTNNQILVANSSTSTGLEWQTPSAAGFVGARAYDTTGTTVSTATWTAIPLALETYDTNTFHDNATNNSRMTIPAGKGGYYQVNAQGLWNTNTTGSRQIAIYKNGGVVIYGVLPASAASGDIVSSVIFTLNLAATDYVQMYAYQNSGGNLAFYPNNTYGGFSVTYLGA
jgi:hypothetical protein